MTITYFLLGSNEGNRRQWLQQAIDAIERSCGHIVKRSALYETAAWGKEDQPDFLNMVIEVETVLSPEQLLQAVQEIELQLGRQRKVKWGQRTLDIDILFYGEAVIHTDRLVVPHPFLQERRFTLLPLQEIAPELMHPVLQKNVTTLLHECPDLLEVKKIDSGTL